MKISILQFDNRGNNNAVHIRRAVHIGGSSSVIHTSRNGENARGGGCVRETRWEGITGLEAKQLLFLYGIH
jgi:hypothetical protein